MYDNFLRCIYNQEYGSFSIGCRISITKPLSSWSHVSYKSYLSIIIITKHNHPSILLSRSPTFFCHLICWKTLQFKKMFQWIEPKICLDNVKGSTSLPVSGKEEECAPCNPGMFKNGTTCEFCPPMTSSDGTSTGKEHELGQWNSTCNDLTLFWVILPILYCVCSIFQHSWWVVL